MTEQNQNQQKDHWQELAEQLGLEPEPAAAVSSPTKKPDDRPLVPVAQVPVKAQQKADVPLPPPEEATPLHHPPARAEEGVKRGAEVSFTRKEPGPDATREADHPTREEENEEMAPRPKRRGGRRSPKSFASDEPPGEESAPTGPEARGEAEEEKKTSRGRHRGRGRGRQKKEEMVEEEAGEPVLAAEEDSPDEAENTPDEAIDEVDTLSDWNVPSWEDLIASLYRPDR